MGWKLWVLIVVVILLVGSTGYLVFAYTSTSSDLKDANATIYDYVAEVAGLERDVASLTDDLDTVTQERDTLQTEKTTLEGEKASLETELDDANSQISSLQSSLSSKTSELNSEKARTTSLQGELNTVMYPRHFNSVQELADWLQQDDTDTQYADKRPAVWSYILQVRALQDGYLLPVSVYVEGQSTYWSNCAVIGGEIYWVYADDDSFYWFAYVSPIPTYPIPQGQ